MDRKSDVAVVQASDEAEVVDHFDAGADICAGRWACACDDRYCHPYCGCAGQDVFRSLREYRLESRRRIVLHGGDMAPADAAGRVATGRSKLRELHAPAL